MQVFKIILEAEYLSCSSFKLPTQKVGPYKGFSTKDIYELKMTLFSAVYFLSLRKMNFSRPHPVIFVQISVQVDLLN